ncbi:MAG TPA: GNAT family N-acetyltransferase [Dehalococcoidia bacterium]|jgi:GNAT superfamily N-acetyltransferase|nr:GNAT family N-acetyltransferase [Dehalococcoidia bacterium]
MSETNVRSEVTYRQANTNDAEAIAGVIAEVVKEPNPVAFERELTPAEVRTWLQRLGGEGGVFLATGDGRVLGFAALDYNTFEPDTVVLGVWMLPEARRKGIGTALAEYALGFARDKGYKRIRGRLPQDNEVALSFLSSIGALVPIYNPEARFELPLV